MCLAHQNTFVVDVTAGVAWRNIQILKLMDCFMDDFNN